MGKTSKAFGFYPEPLRLDAGPIRIEPLPQLDEVVRGVLASDQVEDGWIYAPPQGVRDLMSGQIRHQPYSARVFGLPQTHMIEHAGADGDEHLDFLVWALSFFVGMRLTTTEAGFLDATPLKPRHLVDFITGTQDISKGMELAERFWTNTAMNPATPNGLRPRSTRCSSARIPELCNSKSSSTCMRRLTHATSWPRSFASRANGSRTANESSGCAASLGWKHRIGQSHLPVAGSKWPPFATMPCTRHCTSTLLWAFPYMAGAASGTCRWRWSRSYVDCWWR